MGFSKDILIFVSIHHNSQYNLKKISSILLHINSYEINVLTKKRKLLKLVISYYFVMFHAFVPIYMDVIKLSLYKIVIQSRKWFSLSTSLCISRVQKNRHVEQAVQKWTLYFYCVSYSWSQWPVVFRITGERLFTYYLFVNCIKADW